MPKVRPDFLLSDDKKAILDAKYKYGWSNKDKISCTNEVGIRSDIYQVLAYSRHKAVKARTGENPDIYILYPSSSDENKKNGLSLDKREQIFTDDFDVSIYRVPVFLPIKT